MPAPSASSTRTGLLARTAAAAHTSGKRRRAKDVRICRIVVTGAARASTSRAHTRRPCPRASLACRTTRTLLGGRGRGRRVGGLQQGLPHRLPIRLDAEPALERESALLQQHRQAVRGWTSSFAGCFYPRRAASPIDQIEYGSAWLD